MCFCSVGTPLESGLSENYIVVISNGVGLVVLTELRPQYAPGFEPLVRQLGYLISHSTKWSASRRGVGPWGWKSLQPLKVVSNIVRFTLLAHKVNAGDEPSTPTSVQRGVFKSTHV
ncbi:hypothetical protein YC2023_018238 [Brassica napus]